MARTKQNARMGEKRDGARGSLAARHGIRPLPVSLQDTQNDQGET